MIKTGRKLSGREKRLVLAVGLALAAVAAFRWAAAPAAEALGAAQAAAKARRIECGKLQANLTLQPRIEEIFAELGPRAMQNESDQTTLSLWLRDLEGLGRQPGLTLTAMKPQPVKTSPAARTYRVRLTLLGSLPAVLQYVAAATERFPTLGIDSFSVRGVQAANQVECDLSLCLIRLPAQNVSARSSGREGDRDGR